MSPYCKKINNFINCYEGLEFYIKFRLKEFEIYNRKCLIRKDIDFQMTDDKNRSRGTVMEYVVFVDESYITDSRYRSLSAFSLKKSSYQDIVVLIQSILLESGIKEFKWQKLKDAKYYFCAEKIIKFILDNITKYDIRIDTLVWDTYDSRHTIQGRNDIKNYERMFFHLLNNSMKKRKKNSEWQIYPDIKNDIDWNTIHKVLHNVGKKQEYNKTIFGNFFIDPFYKIKEFQEKESHVELPIQVADLFSGLAVFSCDKYDCYQNYLNSFCSSLFDQDKRIELSKRETFRCKLLYFFNKECKNKKLGVSLKSKGYLYTFNPKNPINFWHYEPQGDYDKAPIG